MTVVVLGPDADLAHVAAFRAQLAPAVEAGRGTIVVDCGAVRTLDSSCLAVLVGVQRRLREQGRVVRLRNVGDEAFRVLHRCGLDLVLEIEAGVTQPAYSTS